MCNNWGGGGEKLYAQETLKEMPTSAQGQHIYVKKPQFLFLRMIQLHINFLINLVQGAVYQ